MYVCRDKREDRERKREIERGGAVVLQPTDIIIILHLLIQKTLMKYKKYPPQHDPEHSSYWESQRQSIND